MSEIVITASAEDITVVNEVLPGSEIATLEAEIAAITASYVHSLNAKAGVINFSVVSRVFTASGTYTPTAGMVYCVIECVGAGAGGGGIANSGAGAGGGAAGGGGGNRSRFIATAAAIGASKTVTVGAHGTGGANTGANGTNGTDTSVGTLCVGKGGSLGGGTSSGVGGAGGVAGTGDVTNPGTSGDDGHVVSTTQVSVSGGRGGGSFLGGQKIQRLSVASAAVGATGSTYGVGGSGGVTFAAGGAAAGGDGADGLVTITEYIIA